MVDSEAKSINNAKKLNSDSANPKPVKPNQKWSKDQLEKNTSKLKNMLTDGESDVESTIKKFLERASQEDT